MKVEHFRFLIIASVIFWLVVGFAFGQTQKSFQADIKIKDTDLIITADGKPQKISLSDKIDAEKITAVNALFFNARPDFIYMVLDVSGQSRAKQNDRQCGAGVESNLLWVKFDANWKVVDVNSVRYESCWSSIDSGESYKITGKILTLEFNNFRDDLNVKLSYNAEQPEKGFQIEQKPLKDK